MTTSRAVRSIWLLAAVLCVPQAPALAASPPAQAEQAKLKIVILEGEGAVNNVRQRTAREVIVEVQDENNRPVGGAVVMFTLPDRGPTGAFANGQRISTVTTGADGRAQTMLTELNKAKGDMAIRVNASHQGARATAIVTQTSVATGVSAAATAGIILGIVAGAGAAAAVALTGGGGSTPSPTPTPTPTPRPTVTISAGQPTVGAP